MIIRITRYLLPGLIALVLLSYAQLDYGQSPGSGLPEQPIRKVKIKEAANVHLVLSALANEYRVPIGLEVAEKSQVETEISIDLQGRPLRDVLDAIIEQDPRYEWKVVDGVINVIPKASRDQFLKDLLETRVERFTIDRGTGRFDIRRKITEIPEVRAKLERAGINHGVGGLITNADFSEAGPDFTLDVSDITVREILNRVIASSETKYWIVNKVTDEDNHAEFIVNF
jgi:hypothetical protein